MKKLLYIISIAFVINSNAQIISTIAGNGIAGFSGDGGQATAAEIHGSWGVSLDATGNLYIADESNNCIRKVNNSGIINTIAGIGGTAGFSGDGGQATAAQLNQPTGVAFDVVNNIYITDYTNNRIRKINTAGIISTIAGNGTAGYTGDGGQATNAEINAPLGAVVFDASGNIYFADAGNSCIRMINTSGIISTFAGNGTGAFLGDGGQATAAELFTPTGVAFDALGNLYIADQYNYCVRKVNTAGIISTVAGIGGSFGFSGDGGQATTAQLELIGIAFDGIGNLYIADSGNQRIRKVNTSGIISTIAGTGTTAFSGDGGAATAAELYDPNNIVLDGRGNLYISDGYNYRVRFICNAPDTVSGLITDPSSAPITAGQVYVYRPKTTNSGLLDTAGFTAINSNGTYNFSNLPYGNYFIEAKPAVSYTNAVSTYYSTHANNYQWDSAVFINHRGCANGYYSGYNITIIEVPTFTGTCGISGNVASEPSFGHRLAGGYNNVMGAPLKGIDVKLGKNPGGGCAARTTTDNIGNYDFTGVDTGSYFVYVDIPNFTDTIANLHLTPANPNYNNINYCVDSVKVHFCGSYTTGLKQLVSITELNIYPNPNNGNFVIEPIVSTEQILSIYDVNGKLVLNKTMTGKSNMDASILNEGVYNISIISNEGVINKRLVIVK